MEECLYQNSHTPDRKERLAAARKGFVATTLKQKEPLTAVATALARGEPADRAALYELAHRVYGTAGTYGFKEVAAAAAALEHEISEGGDAASLSKRVLELAAAIEAMGEEEA